MSARNDWLILPALLFWSAGYATADAGLFLEEPFGLFGETNPTGHAAVYLFASLRRVPPSIATLRGR